MSCLALSLASVIVLGQCPLVYQSETAEYHQVGRRDDDAWNVRAGDPGNRYMQYGPYTVAVVPGVRRATFQLMIDDNTADNYRVLTLDVYDYNAGRVLASKVVCRKDFKRAHRYQDFDLPFESVRGQKHEFRTYWHGGSPIRQNFVKVT